jgi:hypothetical protein
VSAALQTADTGRSSRGWSYYGKALECLRKFAYTEREYAARPDTPGPGGKTGRGSYVHGLLAAYYLHKLAPQDYPDPREWTRNSESVKLLAAEFGVPLADAQEQFSRFLLYCVEYAYEPWEVVSVEQEYQIGFLPQGSDMAAPVAVVEAGTPGSTLYTARLDLVVRNTKTGKVYAVDHKTSALIWRRNPNTGRSYTPSSNYGMTGQMHGHEHLGEFLFGARAGGRFGGVLLNYFQTEGDAAAFKREAPRPAPGLVQAFPRTVVTTAAMIDLFDKHATAYDHWPPKSGYFCPTCPYAKACRGGL